MIMESTEHLINRLITYSVWISHHTFSRVYFKTCHVCGIKYATRFKRQKTCAFSGCKRKFFLLNTDNIDYYCKVYFFTCEYCRKPFSTKKPKAQYCGRSCANAARRNSAIGDVDREKKRKNYSPVYFPICENCGKQFSAKNILRKFCSSKCWGQTRTRKERAKKNYKKNCIACGISFIAKRINKKFCSDKCMHKYIYIQSRAYDDKAFDGITLKDVKCKECGKRFTPSKITAQFCHRDCARKYRNRDPIYHEQLKKKMRDYYRLRKQHANHTDQNRPQRP